ncbi:MFS general substrate transporter [Mollisia scopiformis]|uniref:MFS general substrate transporter n=1 Tax=Mollisia scopiformis TaxID=149040 RepID=A0A194XFN1_MOLSC|nr:MFS general substrate transporter [Mollisia scopiformis]KUJ19005.1 MFS general substrate transporter [Mollisia scopiformis]
MVPTWTKAPPMQAVSEIEDIGEQNTENPFLDQEVAQHWAEVYEKSKYEGRHVFEPTMTWEKDEEKKLVRKLDWHVCLWACIMYFAVQLDRGNLSQAVSDNLLKDLHMNTNAYNYGNMIFAGSFLASEIPSQLIAKRIGPDKWIPVQVICWSIAAASQSAITGKKGFLALRCILGLLEGGFTAEVILWLSYFYTSHELPIRLSFFFTGMSATSIIASLWAYGILHMRGVLGWAGWRWLFLIEGLMTLVAGLASIFMMRASPVQTKTLFQPKGWLNERETRIAINRLLRDDPSKGDMNNRQAISFRGLWNAACDYNLWPLYALGVVAHIPTSPPSKYLTLTLKHLGFSTYNTNLLTIPHSVGHITTMLLLTWFSERVNQRAFVAMLQPLWTLPCILALRFWTGAQKAKDPWQTYALMTVLLSYPYCQAIIVGWCSKNSNNVATRSMSAVFFSMCVQVGSILADNIYREDDKPKYHRGNRNLIIINLLVLVLFLFAKGYYVFQNKKRDKIWHAMTAEEQVKYTVETKVTGAKRLDFRFAH